MRGGLLVAVLSPATLRALRALVSGVRLRAVDLRLELARPLPSDTRVLVRHARNGKDEVPDREPLINKNYELTPSPSRRDWSVRLRCSARIGFQFKCFAVAPPGLANATVDVLRESGVTDISSDAEARDRLWFVLPGVPAYVTVDGFANNCCYASGAITHTRGGP